MTRSDNARCSWAVVGLLAVLSSAVTASAFAVDGQAPPDGAASGATAPATPPPENSAPVPRGLFQTQPAAADKPGFFQSMDRWWNESIANFNAQMKDAKQKLEDFNKKQDQAAKDAAAATQEAMKNAMQATKDAATAMVKLPNTHVIEIRDRCQNAPNGAPDCQTAAANACRTKGFDIGKPLDIQTSQECPAAVFLSGRSPTAGECPPRTMLLRAVCQ